MSSGMRNQRDGRILVVEDDESYLVVLETILEDSGYEHIVTTSDPRKASELYDAFEPDLVLTDLHMPGMNGLDVIAQLRRKGDSHVPIVMLTSDISREAKLRALETGATDFLSKPFDGTECRLRIRNLLQMRFLYQELFAQNRILEEKVAQRTKQLEIAKEEILQRLALAAEYRDDATHQHTDRVGTACALIARALDLSDGDVTQIRRAAPLHDIGKIGIPDSVLLKPGRLSPGEWEVMKRHTVIGSRLLSQSTSPTLRLAQRIALTHHERWDGTGYSGLAGDSIPLVGRILSVADTYDALTHDRPYKEAWSADRALEEVERQREKQFDPQVVDAFLEVERTIDLAEAPANHPLGV